MNNNKPSSVTILFSTTIFLSSFLLFLVELVASKHLLPYFGGSPATWTTSLLFFQAFLLFGYSYSTILIQKTSRQITHIHMLLIIFTSLTLFANTNSPNHLFLNAPSTTSEPIIDIIFYLSKSLGLLFFTLSTTSILVQHWYQKIFPKKKPYFLYAISNFGSFFALIAFPLVFEPNFTSNQVQFFWFIVYMLYLILSTSSLLLFYHLKPKHIPAPFRFTSLFSQTKLRPKTLTWIVLSVISSAYLISSTTKLSSAIAPIPLLWIVPLSLYLISFMASFTSNPKNQTIYARVFLLLIIIFATIQNITSNITPTYSIIVYILIIFSSFLFLHTKLYQNRPTKPEHLGTYYFCISLGGLLGTLLFTTITPVVFKSYQDHTLVLALIAAMCIPYLSRSQTPNQKLKLTTFFLHYSIGFVLVSFTISPIFGSKTKTHTIAKYRNFFGANQIITTDNSGKKITWLVNGNIVHGAQHQTPQLTQTPTTYYSQNSGLGLSINAYRDYLQTNQNQTNLNAVAVGLGVGTFATYGQTGDQITFYELNPQVVTIANTYFSYLNESKANINIEVGDGRLAFAKRSQDSLGSLDIIFLDAFTDDGVPTHLLTKEAFQLYQKNLKPSGVIIIHVSNRYLNLNLLLSETAYSLGFTPLELVDLTWSEPTRPSQYIIFTKNQDLINNYTFKDFVVPKSRSNLKPWTDNYSNIISLLKF